MRRAKPTDARNWVHVERRNLARDAEMAEHDAGVRASALHRAGVSAAELLQNGFAPQLLRHDSVGLSESELAKYVPGDRCTTTSSSSQWTNRGKLFVGGVPLDVLPEQSEAQTEVDGQRAT